jgi:hypothetical protein
MLFHIGHVMTAVIKEGFLVSVDESRHKKWANSCISQIVSVSLAGTKDWLSVDTTNLFCSSAFTTGRC